VPVKILVLGAGAREHALAWRLSRDSDVREVLSAPGNPGMAEIGRCLPADLGDPQALFDLARREAVDLTVVGPESALARGVADVFRHAGLPIVGPTRQGAALESSKAFSKDFMRRHSIPTADFAVTDRLDEALALVAGERFGFPVVVKADGLAAGKGVVIATNRAEAEDAVRAALEDRRFGDAGSRLVIEQHLTGPEVSFFVLADGERVMPLGSAQDHKRIWDDDRGPNTGGMGAFAPSPLVDDAFTERILRDIVRPVITGLRTAGDPYRGFLYVSLMLTVTGPQVIEFNVRLGDPEAQVILPLVEGPFARVLFDAATGDFRQAQLERGDGCYVGVVLASAGYPDQPASGKVITGVMDATDLPETFVFQAGTRKSKSALVTAGGRVLTVVGHGETFAEAMDRAYRGVERISFEGVQYRTDIGRKALTAIAGTGET